MMRKLSIGISFYNSEKYIEKCLYSIINDISKDIEEYVEVLVINDGSNDDSENITKNIIEKSRFTNIKLVNKLNGGVSSARNEIIKSATGEYIWFIDSDDYIIEGSIGKIIKDIKNYATDLYIYQYDMYDGNYQFVERREAIYKNFILNSSFKNKNHFSRDYKEIILSEPAVWHYIFRKNIFLDNNLKFIETSIGEDLNLLTKFIMYSTTFTYRDFPIYNYILHSTSTMREGNIEKYMSIIDSLDDILKFFKSKKLFEEYKEELKALYIINLLFIYDNIFHVNNKSNSLKIILNYLKEKVPDYKNNKYIQEYSLFQKIKLYIKIYDLRLIRRILEKVKK